MTLARDQVCFRAADGAIGIPTDAADDFVRHVRAGAKARSAPIKVRPHLSYSGAVSVRVYWHGDRFHTVQFASDGDGRLLASHKSGVDRIVSLLLHEWLAGSGRFSEIS